MMLSRFQNKIVALMIVVVSLPSIKDKREEAFQEE